MSELKSGDLGIFGKELFERLLRATSSDGSFDDILAFCQKKKKKYTDDSFPPTAKSLINDWTDESEDILEKVPIWSKFIWVRASESEELNDEDGALAIFVNDVSPQDIMQGSLGDCYFLSILSVLAEVPKRIMNLFITDRTNEYGIFCIKTWKNGE